MPERKERLPKRERLQSPRDFRRVYDRGEAFRGRHLIVLVHRADGLGRRAGFVTSRRVGRAVVRNRARRLLRESYRRLRPFFSPSGLEAHYVFIARHGAGRASFEAVHEEMHRLLTRAGALVSNDANTTSPGERKT